MAGAASEAGHYVDLTDFVKENDVLAKMAPATVKFYSEYPGNSGKYWSIPTEGDAIGWSYRKDWFEVPAEMANFKTKYGYDLAVPATWQHLMDAAEFFHRPDQNRYGIAVYTDNSYDALAMGFENALFSYGAELGISPPIRSRESSTRPRRSQPSMPTRSFTASPLPGWGKTFFVENNQAITENLAAMSMNYFAFFPALINESSNPNAANTGYFANPARPDGDQFAALGGQGISVVSYSQNQEEAMKLLKWFIQDDVQKRWAELGGYTCSAAVLESAEFRNATPYSEAFYQTMFKVKDFWAVPEYAELLTALNQRVYPAVVGGEGTSQETLGALAADWKAIFAKYGRGN